jgi:hypothetical protein
LDAVVVDETDDDDENTQADGVKGYLLLCRRFGVKSKALSDAEGTHPRTGYRSNEAAIPPTPIIIFFLQGKNIEIWTISSNIFSL